jgi:DNA-binding CsgD family transcriptional regulator
MLEQVEQGRESYRRRAWRDAYQALSLADQTAPLGVDDLELVATAAYLIGRDADFHRLLDRAHHAHVQAGAPANAARCAFLLGLTLLFRGEVGQGTGWLARARRLIEDRDCVEHGYLLLPTAEQHLAEGNGEAAHSAAARAVEIGRGFRDPDLVACARHVQGRALIQQERVGAGLALLDEAMLAVIGGELSPIFTGLIYCSVIEACQEVFALDRAGEWTSALNRWCEQQPDLVAFTSTCLVHRAEVMQFHGAWPEALAEARRACEGSSGGVVPEPPAAAFYRQAEIHRLRGEFAAAEEAYRSASRMGCEPQPGLALLRLAQGHTDAARAATSRLVTAATDPLRLLRLLPAHIEVMLTVGETQEARSGASTLESLAGRFGTDAVRAMAAQARGAVELAEGDARSALTSLRIAFELWRQVEAPYDAAWARVQIGAACRSLGDDDTGALEVRAAREVFERLGAAPALVRLDALDNNHAAAPKHGLTNRELQVLRLVASGSSNKVIAAGLQVSERTVDRHVSNILRKLNVSSRTAATARAYDDNLL